MISAATGLRLKVIGSSMAMVATGPMPGSTPISVPEQHADQRVQQVDRRDGHREAEEQVVEDVHGVLLADRAGFHEGRAEREGQRQALHEHQHREHDQDDVQDRSLPST